MKKLRRYDAVQRISLSGATEKEHFKKVSRYTSKENEGWCGFQRSDVRMKNCPQLWLIKRSGKKAFSPVCQDCRQPSDVIQFSFRRIASYLPLHKSDPSDTQDVILKSCIGDIIWNSCRRGQEGEQSSAVNQFTLFLFLWHQIADYNWSELQCASVW